MFPSSACVTICAWIVTARTHDRSRTESGVRGGWRGGQRGGSRRRRLGGGGGDAVSPSLSFSWPHLCPRSVLSCHPGVVSGVGRDGPARERLAQKKQDEKCDPPIFTPAPKKNNAPPGRARPATPDHVDRHSPSQPAVRRARPPALRPPRCARARPADRPAPGPRRRRVAAGGRQLVGRQHGGGDKGEKRGRGRGAKAPFFPRVF
jgi:hypothetical protein